MGWRRVTCCLIRTKPLAYNPAFIAWSGTCIDQKMYNITALERLILNYIMLGFSLMIKCCEPSLRRTSIRVGMWAVNFMVPVRKAITSIKITAIYVGYISLGMNRKIIAII